MKNLSKIKFSISCLIISLTVACNNNTPKVTSNIKTSFETKVDSLLSLMTLDEK
jgi:hypothetical protein